MDSDFIGVAYYQVSPQRLAEFKAVLESYGGRFTCNPFMAQVRGDNAEVFYQIPSEAYEMFHTHWDWITMPIVEVDKRSQQVKWGRPELLSDLSRIICGRSFNR